MCRNLNISKKAVFFSLDALIAVTIILTVLILVPTFYIKKEQTTQPVYFSSDIIQLLSTIKIGEINNSAIITLLNNSNVTDLNKTILEQALRFRVDTKYGSESERKKLAEELLNLTIGGVIPDYYNVGIWVEDYSAPIYNTTGQEDVIQLISSKQMVSGIKKDEPIEGFTSRALLSNINERSDSAYTYFGGYEGDGNITKKIFLPDSINEITSAYMELDAGSGFYLYINGISSGNYTASGNRGANEWEINSSYLNNFHARENNITLYFNGTNKYIGGGYLKVSYSTSELVTYNESGVKKYYFPGINGTINVYSSFYVPGTLNKMKISLHYDSNYTMFLNIGNVTVFNDSHDGEIIETIDNAELSSKLNYNSISNKTVPIRLGLENLSYISGVAQQVDVFSVTDLSGSMRCSEGGWCYISQYWCETICGGNWLEPINKAKDANKVLIDEILNTEGNRVGLVGYTGSIENYHPLSDDEDSLKGEVDSYEASGATCICCGINEASEKLVETSDPSKYRSMVVMSDGEANVDCGGTAKQDAIDAACDAYETYGITVYAVGFGSDADMDTLNAIAACGGTETAYYADISTIIDIYQQIAQDIIELSYTNQTLNITGNITTILYPDSFIEFNYTPSTPPFQYGIIPVTIETPRFDNNVTNGTFYIPNNAIVYDAKLTSYSGDKWTDKALIKDNGNWNSFYDLSAYGNNYFVLGDPYIVNIPLVLIKQGENTVRISTGINPINSTGGSPDDRAIYTIGLDLDINYTGVFTKAEGCIWEIEFEDGTHDTIPIPQSYAGTDTCYFTSSQIPNCDTDYNDDAINNAVCNLFQQLDFNNNGKLFVKFGPGDLDIETYSTGKKIPYMWGPTIVEVRVWK